MKFIYKRVVAKKFDKNIKISKKEIENSKTILFSVFSRYGDGVISFVIIKEFIQKYLDKNYILITTPQHYPYAKEILKEFSNIKIEIFNKKSPFSFFYLTYYLKNKNIDLGFNPLSFGDDSIYFILFAKRYSAYKYAGKFTEKNNLYDKTRKYLNLEFVKEKKVIEFEIDKKMKVLIAPFSTEIERSLSIENINFLQNYFKNHILAVPKQVAKKFKKSNLFVFKKSKHSSEKFIELLKKVDLFIGVDSGPLHIALALNKKCIGIFGPTAPSIILNNQQKIKIIRDKRLEGIFCVKREGNPECIYKIINKKMFEIDYKMKNEVLIERKMCPLKKDNL